ncbi:nuclear transport factor 2 [Verruconis gallopava]|uniref:Nuclear transport factor 2 n=1 Tax=Verruconis gallopava TaxID=253628 RepID=A0A0D2ANK4_9PEZI|nr:nuclear transport factor 2 [Verruconis gallopava]KIW08308.1 nuclear transport factor 2 [Verruconis gallopava]
MAANFAEVAQQFVQFYYQTFDENRSNLAGLYKDHSMMTFENSPHQGVAAIIEKLTSLSFTKVKHQITTQDAQPSGEHGGIIVMITGALLVDEEQRPMNFSQVFQLMPADGSFYVLNDIFRLVHG